MAGSDDDHTDHGERQSETAQADAAIVPFPQSRVRPPGGPDPYKELGNSKLSEALGIPKEQMTGHWCSRCKGIWFGYLLEVECPVCGSRDG